MITDEQLDETVKLLQKTKNNQMAGSKNEALIDKVLCRLRETMLRRTKRPNIYLVENVDNVVRPLAPAQATLSTFDPPKI